MDYIGNIEGMKFAPIENYNNFMQGNKSFEVTSGANFEEILNRQTSVMNKSFTVQGGVQMNANFDDIASAAASTENQGPTGNLINSFSKSLNGGLNSVNQAMDSANKAQEAFAMGEDVSVHDVIIASEKATLSFQMAMQLRNKLMSAYNELNNVKV